MTKVPEIPAPTITSLPVPRTIMPQACLGAGYPGRAYMRGTNTNSTEGKRKSRDGVVGNGPEQHEEQEAMAVMATWQHDLGVSTFVFLAIECDKIWDTSRVQNPKYSVPNTGKANYVTRNNIAKPNLVTYTIATHLVRLGDYIEDTWDIVPDPLNFPWMNSRGGESIQPVLCRHRSTQLSKLGTENGLAKPKSNAIRTFNHTNGILKVTADSSGQNSDVPTNMSSLMRSSPPLSWLRRNIVMTVFFGTDLSYFVQGDLVFTKLICPDHSPIPAAVPDYLGLYVKTYEAQPCFDGKIVIVKHYAGFGKNQSAERRERAYLYPSQLE
ncbi:hypothetical protein BU17DRAFT_70797 [Hysterangium stoloniferum]|nr:hypothetical protein BU17DRAFT_70797 [Hysterangium stoloniferum]